MRGVVFTAVHQYQVNRKGFLLMRTNWGCCLVSFLFLFLSMFWCFSPVSDETAKLFLTLQRKHMSLLFNSSTVCIMRSEWFVFNISQPWAQYFQHSYVPFKSRKWPYLEESGALQTCYSGLEHYRITNDCSSVAISGNKKDVRAEFDHHRSSSQKHPEWPHKLTSESNNIHLSQLSLAVF